MTRRVVILGSTGSIGTQTLDVIAQLNALHERGEYPERFEVVGLAAGNNRALLAEQARRFGVRHVACTGAIDVAGLPSGSRRYSGPGAAEELVRGVDGVDLVVAAIVGIAGLPATIAAVQEGRSVALANKEALVAAGELIMPLARASDRDLRMLPLDSEHSALWQCLLAGMGPRTCAGDSHEREWSPPWVKARDLSRVVLTASGGPFRTWTKAQIDAATPAQALKHPTWSMGRKVTVDSASLMNKGLEIIEARWLFDLPGSMIEAVVHPQSMVHAIAEYSDGAMIAHMGATDMRCPIQLALTWPRRGPAGSRRLDWRQLSKLEFEPVDTERFPLITLAYRAIERGGTAGAILNAANEVAVQAFLASAESATPMRFGAIYELVADAFECVKSGPMRTLEDCLGADAAAREHVRSKLKL